LLSLVLPDFKPGQDGSGRRGVSARAVVYAL